MAITWARNLNNDMASYSGYILNANYGDYRYGNTIVTPVTTQDVEDFLKNNKTYPFSSVSNGEASSANNETCFSFVSGSVNKGTAFNAFAVSGYADVLAAPDRQDDSATTSSGGASWFYWSVINQDTDAPNPCGNE